MLYLLRLEEQNWHYWQKYFFANMYRLLLLNESLCNTSVDNWKTYECTVQSRTPLYYRELWLHQCSKASYFKVCC